MEKPHRLTSIDEFINFKRQKCHLLELCHYISVKICSILKIKWLYFKPSDYETKSLVFIYKLAYVDNMRKFYHVHVDSQYEINLTSGIPPGSWKSSLSAFRVSLCAVLATNIFLDPKSKNIWSYGHFHPLFTSFLPTTPHLEIEV